MIGEDGIPIPGTFNIPTLGELKGLFSHYKDKELGSMETANIVVAGAAGVGKSTLINAMFGAEFAKTGIGEPITKNVDRIAVPGKPIVLYDTRGLEIENSEETIAALSGLIRDLRAKENASDQIHCLWLCVAADSNRFETAHTSILSMCAGYRIPVIVVLTKDYLGSDDFGKYIVDKYPAVHDVVPVVAMARQSTRGGAIGRFGLDTLLDSTLEVIPEAAKASVEYAQIAVVARKVEAATSIVNWSAGTGVATAFPLSVIPFAHTALLIPLQVNMIVQINKALGVNMTEDESNSLMVGLGGVIAAAVGGKAVFVELIKIIPVAGTVAGMVIGAAVAGTVVKALGTIYIAFMVEAITQNKPLDYRTIVDGMSRKIKEESWRFKSS